ncbi:MAG: ACT domain-containing protein, partial [Bacteroidota bacterium]
GALPDPPVPADVRALIDRIAAALGDAATPERVEHIARAVLHAERTDSPPAPTRVTSARASGASGLAAAEGPAPGQTRFVVTAYGLDTPGVLAALTSELAAHGANILDVSQKVLQGYFTVVLFADLPDGGPDLATVRQRLQARGEALGARVLAQHEELFQAMHRP